MDRSARVCSTVTIAVMSSRSWSRHSAEREVLQVLAEGGRDLFLARTQFYLGQLIEQRCPDWAKQYPDMPRLLGRTNDSANFRTREDGAADRLTVEIDFQVHTPEWGWLNKWRWNRWAKRQVSVAVEMALEDFHDVLGTAATEGVPDEATHTATDLR